MIGLQKEAGPDEVRWGLATYAHSSGSLPKRDKMSLNGFKEGVITKKTIFYAHLSGKNVEMTWPQFTLEAKSPLGAIQGRHKGDKGDGEKWPNSRDMQEIASAEFID